MNILAIGSLVIDHNHKTETISIGGDAFNEAVMLTKMGHHVYISALIGNDVYKDVIFEECKKFGIETEYLACSDEYHTTVSHIYFDEQNERYFKVDGGAHRQFRKEHFNEDVLTKIDALSIASLFSLQEFQKDGMLEMLKKAKALGVTTFADTSTDRHHLGINGFGYLLPYIDYFLPGLSEMQASLQRESLNEIGAVLLQSGACNVVFKLGGEGACYLKENQPLYFRATHYEHLVDTTGCGDCFCAAFISEILLHGSIDKAVMYACWIGSLNTQFSGAHNLSKEELIRKMPN